MTAMASPIEDREWVAQRLNEGGSVTAIADLAGVSRQTAHTWVRRHGLTPNPRGRQRPSPAQLQADYEEAGSVSELASRYGIPRGTVQMWLRESGADTSAGRQRTGRPAVAIDTDAVSARRERGDTWHAIAADLGVSVQTLRRRLSPPE